jgi:hypothetical protein
MLAISSGAAQAPRPGEADVGTFSFASDDIHRHAR